MGVDLGDTSLRSFLVCVDPGKSGVATALSAGPQQLPFRASPGVPAWRREKALMVAAHAALRAAVALTLLAAELASEEQLRAAMQQAHAGRAALPACLQPPPRRG